MSDAITLEDAEPILRGVFPKAEVSLELDSWEDDNSSSRATLKLGPNRIVVEEAITGDPLSLRWVSTILLDTPEAATTGDVRRDQITVRSVHDLIGWLSTIRMKMEQDILNVLLRQFDPNHILPLTLLHRTLSAYSNWLGLGNTHDSLGGRLAPLFVAKFPLTGPSFEGVVDSLLDGDADAAETDQYITDGWQKGSDDRWALRVCGGHVVVGPDWGPRKLAGKILFAGFGTALSQDYSWNDTVGGALGSGTLKTMSLTKLLGKCLAHLRYLHTAKPFQSRKPVFVSATDL